MLDSGGDEAIALSKYNHRPTDRAVHNNPETMRYIQTVMAIQAQVAANGGQQTPAGNIATTEIHIANLNVNGLNTASATQFADNVKNIAGINNINAGMRQ